MRLTLDGLPKDKKSILLLLIIIISTLICLYSSWRVFHALTLQPSSSKPSRGSINTQSVQKKASPLKLMPLFGKYIPDGSLSQTTPKTLLNLNLLGVLLAKPQNISQAIIQISSGRENVYHLNDVIPGGAKIIRIDSDKVLLLQNGRIEKLSLPKSPLRFEEHLESLEFEDP